jgi:bifunctional enzyme CysN/CysC
MSSTELENQRLKIVIVGHVDHGKSTLIGRLFYDTNSLPDGKVESIRKACEAEGMEFEYAFLLDALLEEQEQNITIDTTQIHFRTARRNYVIIDAPGHKEFLKNMITGAASADAAILLIDAHEGVQEQSRRHGYLLSLLGVKQVIVAVNKMDLIGFSEEKFEAIRKEYTEFLRPLGVHPSHFIPISAKHGHNIIKPSVEMPWNHEPTILNALDSFSLPPSRDNLPLRLTVQDIYRFDERRIIAGRIEAGTLSVGDELIFWPDRKRSKVKSIEAWSAASPVTQSSAGRSVALTLTEQIFVERGQIASHTKDTPVEGREINARLFWLSDEPLRLESTHTLKLGTQSVEARLVKINRVIDSSTLNSATEARSEIVKNEAAEIVLRTRRPLAFDNHNVITETGRFVLIQGSRIGGGGIIHNAVYSDVKSDAVKSENLSWNISEVTSEDRIGYFSHRGAVIWLTGLSGSGKSTLSTALEASLFKRGHAAFVLDGDNLRHGLCANLGFSDEDRTENIRRAGEAAKLLADSGLIVITALISPFAKDRDKVREICSNGGIPFAEIFVNAPLAVCEQRDPKNLYAKARKGEIKGFTGIDSPYEPPQKPELELPTDQLTKEECLTRLLDLTQNLSQAEDSTRAEEINPESSI